MTDVAVTEKPVEQFTAQALLHELKKELDYVKTNKEELNTYEKKAAQEREERIHKSLDKIDELAQKNYVERKVLDETVKSFEDKIQKLEEHAAKFGTNNPERKEKTKIINDLITYTKCLAKKDQLPERISKSYFRSDVNRDGGFLLGTEFYSDTILKPVVPFSNVRALTSVIQSSSLTNNFISLDEYITVSNIGEGQTVPDTNAKYRDVKISLNEQIVRVSVTNRLLTFSAYNLENEINSQVSKKMQQDEGRQFVKGTGSKEAVGFMTNPDIPILDTENVGSITVDDLITLSLSLESQYNPYIAMNRFTMQIVRKFATTTGQLQFYQGDFTLGQINAINGVPVVIFPDMPGTSTATSGTKPMIVADFSELYRIVDGMNVSVMVDPYSQLQNQKIVYQFSRWIGGDVVMPEAGYILRVKS